MKFIAEDGAVFDKQEDCESYENYGITPETIANVFKASVTLYDRNKQLIDLTYFENRVGFEWLDELFSCMEKDDCYYVRIDCNEEVFNRILEFIDTEYAVSFPYNIGLFSWDDGWVSYKEAKTDFDRRWKGIAF